MWYYHTAHRWYGVFSFVSSDLCSAAVTAVLHMLDLYIGPYYEGTRLYYYRVVLCNKGLHDLILLSKSYKSWKVFASICGSTFLFTIVILKLKLNRMTKYDVIWDKLQPRTYKTIFICGSTRWRNVNIKSSTYPSIMFNMLLQIWQTCSFRWQNAGSWNFEHGVNAVCLLCVNLSKIITIYFVDKEQRNKDLYKKWHPIKFIELHGDEN